jgi:Uma2 family endonuclease
MARVQVVLDPPELEEDGLRLRSCCLTREQYRAFCHANPELRIERLASGEVVIMPPTHSRSGAQNAALVAQLVLWAHKDGRGVAFDNNTGFDLPNGANRSPDAAWVLKSRIEALSQEDREEYLPLSPDFVIELRSRSDRLSDLKNKMQEYIDSGTRLGWLIDPIVRQAHIFRPGLAFETLANPGTLSGDPELPGFQLDLTPVWNPGV